MWQWQHKSYGQIIDSKVSFNWGKNIYAFYISKNKLLINIYHLYIYAFEIGVFSAKAFIEVIAWSVSGRGRVVRSYRIIKFGFVGLKRSAFNVSLEFNGPWMTTINLVHQRWKWLGCYKFSMLVSLWIPLKIYKLVVFIRLSFFYVDSSCLFMDSYFCEST